MKISEEKHLIDFKEQGHIHAKTVSYFSKIEIDEVRRDPYEEVAYASLG